MIAEYLGSPPALDPAGGAHQTVQLPVGLWKNGVRHRNATVRPLTGAEEEWIGQMGSWPSPAARVSALLSRAVIGIDPDNTRKRVPGTTEEARALSVLDRDALLLAIRRSLFGDRVQVTVTCPDGACGQKIDLDFHLGDMPIPRREEEAPQYEATVDGHRIIYRLPNGGDQEVAAPLATADLARAERAILERCIQQIDGSQGAPDLLDRLSPHQLRELEEEMARRDPQLDSEIATYCPNCGAEFSIRFDIVDFLLRELADALPQLYRQVHTLAWYYHWSESEILSLPLPKRHLYLSFLAAIVGEVEGTWT